MISDGALAEVGVGLVGTGEVTVGEDTGEGSVFFQDEAGSGTFA